MPRKRHLNDTEMRAAVEQAIQRSDWWDGSSTSAEHQDALNRYLGRYQKTSLQGDYDWRSNDVADAIDALTAQIMPAFNFDEIAEFEGHHEGDIDQAKLESKIVNQVIQDFNNGQVEIQQAVKNALTLRNGVLRVIPQEREIVEYENHKDMDALAFAQVQQPTAQNQTVEVTNTSTNGDLLNARIKRTTTLRSLEVCAVDTVNIIVQKEWTSVDLTDCPVAGERWFATRSDLISMGYPKDKVDLIPRTEADTRQGSLARNRYEYQPHLHYGADRSTEQIEMFTLYMLIDKDRDGVAERRKIVYAGGVSGGHILEDDLYPFVPYATGVPFIYPHRWQGISVVDKLKELEDQKSDALSQYRTNLANSNFPELEVVDGDVAEMDYKQRRAGGVIRVDRAGSVNPIPIHNIGRESLAFLNYADQVRAERVGASIDMMSNADVQIANSSAHGVERMASAREVMAAHICTTLGNTLVRQLFKLVHESLRVFFPGEQNFSVGASQYTTANPANWPMRQKVRVVAGMSNADRQMRRAVLEQTLLQQEKLFGQQQDGVLVDYKTYYSTLVDWSKSGGLHSPRRYWLDPSTDAAQQTLEAKRQAAQEEQQRQYRLQSFLFEAQILISDRDRQADLMKHFSDLAHKYWSDVLDSEVEEMKAAQKDELDEDQNRGRLKAIDNG